MMGIGEGTPTVASCPTHLVFGSLVLVQLSLQNLLCELHFCFPLSLLLLEWRMGSSAGLGLLHSLLLPKHHRVPKLEPLQKAAVRVLCVGQERNKGPVKSQHGPAKDTQEVLSFMA